MLVSKSEWDIGQTKIDPLYILCIMKRTLRRTGSSTPSFWKALCVCMCVYLYYIGNRLLV